MTALFAGANSFNQTLNSWDVSSVTHMPMMFADISFFTPASPGIVFNQPLNSWNVSNVTDMQGMFLGAENYNQSLASWNVSNVTDMTYMFGDAGGLAPASSGLSTANYDATLTAWNALTLQNGVTFDAGTSTYCSSVADRANMISSDGWTINDSGENCGATALTATINQSIGQQDPTSTNPITYTVVFSEAIDPSTFTQDDLWLSSGSGNIADLTTSDNITWNVTVNANSPGYFTLQLQEQRVQTMGGTFNEAATSTDNTVSFQYLQTDFSLVKTLSTAGEIKNGDSVTYHFKIKNEGPNDSFYSGVVYDVLPLEFTFESNTNPLVTCSDMGLAEDLGEPYFAYHFSGHHMLACMPVNGGSDTLTNGSSIEFDITGTASGNYITNSTTNKSVYFDVSSRENDAMLVMNNAFSNNIDLTTLPINNVSNAVYTWSPAVPTPDPTPTPDPAPTPTTSTPTKPKTPRTPANPNTPATAPTNTENSPSVSNPVALEKLEEPDLPKEVLGRRTGLPLLIYNTFHGFSDTVAKIITWLPLIALIVIALLYSYRARREYKTLLYLQRVISRYRGTKEAIANYSNITTHYLNTPVAIMNGAVELLASLKKLPDWAITHLGTILKSYSADVVKLSSLSQVAASPQTLGVSIAGPIAVVNDVQYSATNAKKSAIKQKAVWLPIAISFAALALASALFVYADVYALNTVQLMLQIFCLVLVSGLVIFSYHNKVVQLAAQAVAKQTIQAEQALIASRTKFLKQAGDVLSEHYNNFVLATKDFKFIPETKTLFGGLAMLGELTKSINNTYSLTSLSSDSPMQKLAQEIPKVVNDLKPALDAKNIKVTTDIDTDASATLQPAELKQLIGSVVANAVQYSPDGGEIKIAAKNSGNKAVISVTDHGQGMTADKLMRLFEPFNKATSTETYDHQGLGLSLHTDKLITEKLGGKIEVASKTDVGNQGTTVTITLPIGETSPLKAPVLIAPATA